MDKNPSSLKNSKEVQKENHFLKICRAFIIRKYKTVDYRRMHFVGKTLFFVVSLQTSGEDCFRIPILM